MVVRPHDAYILEKLVSLVFTCGGKTDPDIPLSIRWFHDGYQLKNGQSDVYIKQTSVTDNSQLTVMLSNDTTSRKSREGMYICELDNGFSSVSEFAMVWYVPTNETVEPQIQQCKHLIANHINNY